jgi:plasmid maintenance system antidote protein VapI
VTTRKFLKEAHPADVLKILMSEKGHSQRWLSDQIGMDRGNLSKILSKQLGISKELGQKLSDFYSVDQSLFVLEKPTGDGELASLMRREAFLEREIASVEKILKQAENRKVTLERELADVRQAIKDQ